MVVGEEENEKEKEEKEEEEEVVVGEVTIQIFVVKAIQPQSSASN